MKKYRGKIAILIMIVLLVIGVQVFDLQGLFSIENINGNLDIIKGFVADNLILSIIIFIGVYTAAVAFALPFATVLSLGSGLILGLQLGVVLVVFGATLGATINFLLTRYLLGEQIQKKYNQRLSKINEELDANGKNYLLMLRLIPIFPFFLINIAAGLSNVKLSTFVWTTGLGIIPGTFAYVYLGASLNSLNADGAGLPMPILIGLALIGVMTLLPVIYKKLKKA